MQPYREIIEQHELLVPQRIIFEWGGSARLGELAHSMANPGKVFLVTPGQSAQRAGLGDRVGALLQAAGFTVAEQIAVTAEPTAPAVDAAAARVRAIAPSLIIGIGGGSAIDFGKALAALAVNPGSVEDYLEGVGQGWVVEQDPLPYLAVPTTSGTGAEMTKNAVIADHEKGYKKSMRDARMIPTVALLDPELTTTVPRAVTAASGMDALTQLIEPCISVKRKPGPTVLAHRALRGLQAALPVCCAQPEDADARSTLSLASGISGICLANSGLALAHGVASGLGGLHPVPHGEICGILLPHTLRYNRDACETELGEALMHVLGEPDVTPDTIDRGITAIEELNRQTGVPPTLKHLALDDAEIQRVAAASMGSSMSGNPVEMTTETIYGFLRPLM